MHSLTCVQQPLNKNKDSLPSFDISVRSLNEEGYFMSSNKSDSEDELFESAMEQQEIYLDDSYTTNEQIFDSNIKLLPKIQKEMEEKCSDEKIPIYYDSTHESNILNEGIPLPLKELCKSVITSATSESLKSKDNCLEASIIDSNSNIPVSLFKYSVADEKNIIQMQCVESTSGSLKEDAFSLDQDANDTSYLISPSSLKHLCSMKIDKFFKSEKEKFRSLTAESNFDNFSSFIPEDNAMNSENILECAQSVQKNNFAFQENSNMNETDDVKSFDIFVSKSGIITQDENEFIFCKDEITTTMSPISLKKLCCLRIDTEFLETEVNKYSASMSSTTKSDSDVVEESKFISASNEFSSITSPSSLKELCDLKINTIYTETERNTDLKSVTEINSDTSCLYDNFVKTDDFISEFDQQTPIEFSLQSHIESSLSTENFDIFPETLSTTNGISEAEISDGSVSESLETVLEGINEKNAQGLDIEQTSQTSDGYLINIQHKGNLEGNIQKESELDDSCIIQDEFEPNDLLNIQDEFEFDEMHDIQEKPELSVSHGTPENIESDVTYNIQKESEVILCGIESSFGLSDSGTVKIDSVSNVTSSTQEKSVFSEISSIQVESKFPVECEIQEEIQTDFSNNPENIEITDIHKDEEESEINNACNIQEETELNDICFSAISHFYEECIERAYPVKTFLSSGPLCNQGSVLEGNSFSSDEKLDSPASESSSAADSFDSFEDHNYLLEEFDITVHTAKDNSNLNGDDNCIINHTELNVEKEETYVSKKWQLEENLNTTIRRIQEKNNIDIDRINEEQKQSSLNVTSQVENLESFLAEKVVTSDVFPVSKLHLECSLPLQTENFGISSHKEVKKSEKLEEILKPDIESYLHYVTQSTQTNDSFEDEEFYDSINDVPNIFSEQSDVIGYSFLDLKKEIGIQCNITNGKTELNVVLEKHDNRVESLQTSEALPFENLSEVSSAILELDSCKQFLPPSEVEKSESDITEDSSCESFSENSDSDAFVEPSYICHICESHTHSKYLCIRSTHDGDSDTGFSSCSSDIGKSFETKDDDLYSLKNITVTSDRQEKEKLYEVDKSVENRKLQEQADSINLKEYLVTPCTSEEEKFSLKEKSVVLFADDNSDFKILSLSKKVDGSELDILVSEHFLEEKSDSYDEHSLKSEPFPSQITTVKGEEAEQKISLSDSVPTEIDYRNYEQCDISKGEETDTRFFNPTVEFFYGPLPLSVRKELNISSDYDSDRFDDQGSGRSASPTSKDHDVITSDDKQSLNSASDANNLNAPTSSISLQNELCKNFSTSQTVGFQYNITKKDASYTAEESDEIWADVFSDIESTVTSTDEEWADAEHVLHYESSTDSSLYTDASQLNTEINYSVSSTSTDTKCTENGAEYFMIDSDECSTISDSFDDTFASEIADKISDHTLLSELNIQEHSESSNLIIIKEDVASIENLKPYESDQTTFSSEVVNSQHGKICNDSIKISFESKTSELREQKYSDFGLSKNKELSRLDIHTDSVNDSSLKPVDASATHSAEEVKNAQSVGVEDEVQSTVGTSESINETGVDSSLENVSQLFSTVSVIADKKLESNEKQITSSTTESINEARVDSSSESISQLCSSVSVIAGEKLVSDEVQITVGMCESINQAKVRSNSESDLQLFSIVSVIADEKLTSDEMQITVDTPKSMSETGVASSVNLRDVDSENIPSEPSLINTNFVNFPGNDSVTNNSCIYVNDSAKVEHDNSGSCNVILEVKTETRISTNIVQTETDNDSASVSSDAEFKDISSSSITEMSFYDNLLNDFENDNVQLESLQEKAESIKTLSHVLIDENLCSTIKNTNNADDFYVATMPQSISGDISLTDIDNAKEVFELKNVNENELFHNNHVENGTVCPVSTITVSDNDLKKDVPNVLIFSVGTENNIDQNGNVLLSDTTRKDYDGNDRSLSFAIPPEKVDNLESLTDDEFKDVSSNLITEGSSQCDYTNVDISLDDFEESSLKIEESLNEQNILLLSHEVTDSFSNEEEVLPASCDLDKNGRYSEGISKFSMDKCSVEIINEADKYRSDLAESHEICLDENMISSQSEICKELPSSSQLSLVSFDTFTESAPVPDEFADVSSSFTSEEFIQQEENSTDGSLYISMESSILEDAKNNFKKFSENSAPYNFEGDSITSECEEKENIYDGNSVISAKMQNTASSAYQDYDNNEIQNKIENEPLQNLSNSKAVSEFANKTSILRSTEMTKTVFPFENVEKLGSQMFCLADSTLAAVRSSELYEEKITKIINDEKLTEVLNYPHVEDVPPLLMCEELVVPSHVRCLPDDISCIVEDTVNGNSAEDISVNISKSNGIPKCMFFDSDSKFDSTFLLKDESGDISSYHSLTDSSEKKLAKEREIMASSDITDAEYKLNKFRFSALDLNKSQLKSLNVTENESVISDAKNTKLSLTELKESKNQITSIKSFPGISDFGLATEIGLSETSSNANCVSVAKDDEFTNVSSQILISNNLKDFNNETDNSVDDIEDDVLVSYVEEIPLYSENVFFNDEAILPLDSVHLELDDFAIEEGKKLPENTSSLIYDQVPSVDTENQKLIIGNISSFIADDSLPFIPENSTDIGTAEKNLNSKSDGNVAKKSIVCENELAASCILQQTTEGYCNSSVEPELNEEVASITESEYKDVSSLISATDESENWVEVTDSVEEALNKYSVFSVEENSITKMKTDINKSVNNEFLTTESKSSEELDKNENLVLSSVDDDKDISTLVSQVMDSTHIKQVDTAVANKQIESVTVQQIKAENFSEKKVFDLNIDSNSSFSKVSFTENDEFSDAQSHLLTADEPSKWSDSESEFCSVAIEQVSSLSCSLPQAENKNDANDEKIHLITSLQVCPVMSENTLQCDSSNYTDTKSVDETSQLNEYVVFKTETSSTTDFQNNTSCENTGVVYSSPFEESIISQNDVKDVKHDDSIFMEYNESKKGISASASSFNQSVPEISVNLSSHEDINNLNIDDKMHVITTVKDFCDNETTVISNAYESLNSVISETNINIAQASVANAYDEVCAELNEKIVCSNDTEEVIHPTVTDDYKAFSDDKIVEFDNTVCKLNSTVLEVLSEQTVSDLAICKSNADEAYITVHDEFVDVHSELLSAEDSTHLSDDEVSYFDVDDEVPLSNYSSTFKPSVLDEVSIKVNEYSSREEFTTLKLIDEDHKKDTTVVQDESSTSIKTSDIQYLITDESSSNTEKLEDISNMYEESQVSLNETNITLAKNLSDTETVNVNDAADEVLKSVKSENIIRRTLDATAENFKYSVPSDSDTVVSSCDNTSDKNKLDTASAELCEKIICSDATDFKFHTMLEQSDKNFTDTVNETTNVSTTDNNIISCFEGKKDEFISTVNVSNQTMSEGLPEQKIPELSSSKCTADEVSTTVSDDFVDVHSHLLTTEDSAHLSDDEINYSFDADDDVSLLNYIPTTETLESVNEVCSLNITDNSKQHNEKCTSSIHDESDYSKEIVDTQYLSSNKNLDNTEQLMDFDNKLKESKILVLKKEENVEDSSVQVAVHDPSLLLVEKSSIAEKVEESCTKFLVDSQSSLLAADNNRTLSTDENSVSYGKLPLTTDSDKLVEANKQKDTQNNLSSEKLLNEDLHSVEHSQSPLLSASVDSSLVTNLKMSENDDRSTNDITGTAYKSFKTFSTDVNVVAIHDMSSHSQEISDPCVINRVTEYFKSSETGTALCDDNTSGIHETDVKIERIENQSSVDLKTNVETVTAESTVSVTATDACKISLTETLEESTCNLISQIKPADVCLPSNEAVTASTNVEITQSFSIQHSKSLSYDNQITGDINFGSLTSEESKNIDMVDKDLKISEDSTANVPVDSCSQDTLARISSVTKLYENETQVTTIVNETIDIIPEEIANISLLEGDAVNSYIEPLLEPQEESEALYDGETTFDTASADENIMIPSGCDFNYNENYFDYEQGELSDNELDISLEYESWSERSFDHEEGISFPHHFDPYIEGEGQFDYNPDEIIDDGIINTIDMNLRDIEAELNKDSEFQNIREEEFECYENISEEVIRTETGDLEYSIAPSTEILESISEVSEYFKESIHEDHLISHSNEIVCGSLRDNSILPDQILSNLSTEFTFSTVESTENSLIFSNYKENLHEKVDETSTDEEILRTDNIFNNSDQQSGESKHFTEVNSILNSDNVISQTNTHHSSESSDISSMSSSRKESAPTFEQCQSSTLKAENELEGTFTSGVKQESSFPVCLKKLDEETITTSMKENNQFSVTGKRENLEDIPLHKASSEEIELIDKHYSESDHVTQESLSSALKETSENSFNLSNFMCDKSDQKVENETVQSSFESISTGTSNESKNLCDNVSKSESTSDQQITKHQEKQIRVKSVSNEADNQCKLNVMDEDKPPELPKKRLSIEERMLKLQTEGKCLDKDKAFIAAKLIEMQFEESDALLASHQCNSVYHAIKFLTQMCEMCNCRYPVNHMASMVHCPHKACKDCLKAHFTTLIYDRSVFSLLCPICHQPDISDRNVQEYFSHLDIVLRGILKKDIYDLFQRKLRDEVLTKDPNFHWCSQCSSGFIASPRLKKLYCPDCFAITCALCHQTWEIEHEGVHCERFQLWKDMHTPEPPPAGLVKLLAERGVTCPSCGIKYFQASGGCIFYKCEHCNYEFCGFCLNPYKRGRECKMSSDCNNSGIHAHHPYNCLFYLRDLPLSDLQQLLQKNSIPYLTIPPPEQIVRRRCQVREQKHVHGAITEDRCGRDIEPYCAGLCKLHFYEYLCELLRKHSICPLSTMTTFDLQFILRKARMFIPDKIKSESLKEYHDKLYEIVSTKLKP